PVDEIVAQREGADRRAGHVVAALAVLRVGKACEQGEVVGQLLAAVHAGREGADRAEGGDAVAAVDLLVGAEQDLAEHLVGDHLIEALVGEAADGSAAGAAVCRGCRDRRLIRWRSLVDGAGAVTIGRRWLARAIAKYL